MSANFAGVTCGGLLEYNSMYFGFRSLYVLAFVIYGVAFLTSVQPVSNWLSRRDTS